MTTGEQTDGSGRGAGRLDAWSGDGRTVAVVVAAVVLLAGAAAVFVLVGGGSPGEGPTNASGASDATENLTGDPAPAPTEDSLSIRMTVVAALERTNRSGAAETVSNTTGLYADANHTRAPPFATDREVVESVDNATVARRLALADAALARTAIRDVRRARRLLAARNVTYDRSRVERLLATARRAARNGAIARRDSPGEAIRYYARAWRHAQRALDWLDAAHDPRIRIEPPGAVEGRPTNLTITGRVVDVRPADVENVTVSVGERNWTVGVYGRSVPLEPAPFSATIRLRDRGTTLSARATDPGGGRVSDDVPGENATGATTVRIDGDGLSEGFERRRDGVDPLDPDTDGDGRVDGRETFTTTASAGSPDAAVTVTGRGNVARTVSIRRETRPRVRSAAIENASVTPVVRVEARRAVERATVRLGYDPAAVENRSDLVVVAYGEDRGRYVPLPTRAYPDNETLVARTEGFSTFVGVERRDLAGELSDLADPGPTTVTLSEDFEDGNATYFDDVVDRVGYGGESYALAGHEAGGPARTAAVVNTSNFSLRMRFMSGRTVERTPPGTQFGVEILDPYYEGIDVWVRGRPRITVQHNHDGGVGWNAPNYEATFGPKTTNGSWYVLRLESKPVGGEPTIRAKVWPANGSEPGEWQVNVSAGENWLNGTKARLQVMSLDSRFGTWVDRYDLRTYTRHADTDADGLADAEERNGMVTGTGRRIRTNYTDPDTDDDGLEDGTEMGDERDGNRLFPRYYETSTDPTDPTSDDFGMEDGWEVENGTDPRENETQVVFAKLPVRARNGRPVDIPGGTLLEPAGVHYHQGRNAPSWLKQSIPGSPQAGTTYILLDVPVYVANENASEHITKIQFSFTGENTVVYQYGHRKIQGHDEYAFSDDGVGIGTEGVRVVSLVVQYDGAISPKHPDNMNFYGTLGQFQMTVVRDPRSKFARARDNASEFGPGHTEQTITSSRTYVVKNYGLSKLQGMYEEGIARIQTGAVATLGLNMGPISESVSGAAQVLVLHGASSGTVTATLAVQGASVVCSAAAQSGFIRNCPTAIGGGDDSDRGPDVTDPGEFGGVDTTPTRETVLLHDVVWTGEVGTRTIPVGGAGVRARFHVRYTYTGVGIVRQD